MTANVMNVKMNENNKENQEPKRSRSPRGTQTDLLADIKKLLNDQTSVLTDHIDQATKTAKEAKEIASEAKTMANSALEEVKNIKDIMEKNAATASTPTASTQGTQTNIHDKDTRLLYVGGFGTKDADEIEEFVQAILDEHKNIKPVAWRATRNGTAAITLKDEKSVWDLIRGWKNMNVEANGERIWISKAKSRYEYTKDRLVAKAKKTLAHVIAENLLTRKIVANYRRGTVDIEGETIMRVNIIACRALACMPDPTAKEWADSMDILPSGLGHEFAVASVRQGFEKELSSS